MKTNYTFQAIIIVLISLTVVGVIVDSISGNERGSNETLNYITIGSFSIVVSYYFLRMTFNIEKHFYNQNEIIRLLKKLNGESDIKPSEKKEMK